MATIAITFDSLCKTGGDHARLNASLNGGAAQQFVYTLDEALGGLPLDDPEYCRGFVLNLVKLHCQGMSLAQAKAAILAGVTVTV